MHNTHTERADQLCTHACQKKKKHTQTSAILTPYANVNTLTGHQKKKKKTNNRTPPLFFFPQRLYRFSVAL